MQETDDLITRREAIRRVSALLGGVALVGGDALLTGCRDRNASTVGRSAAFTTSDIAFLDEVAETILPATRTPGAKAAKTGAFMALMVTDSYAANDQQIFREGMRTVDDRCRKMHDVAFMQATPPQRLAVLHEFDKDQKAQHDASEVRHRAESMYRLNASPPARSNDAKSAEAPLPDDRKENAVGQQSNGAAAISAEPPPHFFRMVKELTLLGYFTSEIGYTQAQRYIETPGRFEPCVPYTKGDRAWAGHA